VAGGRIGPGIGKQENAALNLAEIEPFAHGARSSGASKHSHASSDLKIARALKMQLCPHYGCDLEPSWPNRTRPSRATEGPASHPIPASSSFLA